jgi:uncharacterized protein
LIAAISGRALAAAARRAGFVPYVADFFADADTARIAQACHKLDGDIKHGLTWAVLEPALLSLASLAPTPLLGFVFGSGFEDRTDLLQNIAQRWTVLGNDASVVERVKAPARFFGELHRLGVAHPPTSTEPPVTVGGWLAKRQGGAGGSHITASHAVAGPEGIGKAQIYFQQQVPGRPVSAIFVGNGARAVVLGFSEQWAAPRQGAMWRYGGALRPARLPQGLRGRITAVVEKVAPAFALKGLCSADFLVNGDEAALLEINPRPGATLDIFDREHQPLLGLHLDAVLEHRLPTLPFDLPGAAAAAIVYAPQPLVLPSTMIWPDWSADQPRPGERIDKNRPICTVLARSETAAEAKRLLKERMGNILAACACGEGGDQ